MDKNKAKQEKDFKRIVEMIERAKKEAREFAQKNTKSGVFVK